MAWLDLAPPEGRLKELLSPYSAEATQVRAVNSPKHDGPE
jgi:hypothetical protein